MDVAIIDYETSNLHSVQAACRKVGLSSLITSDERQILDARVAILPGVGAFGEAMKHLIQSKLDQTIYKFVETGKLFIGICLGLQLLLETSEEFGGNNGLGIIKGNVKKLAVKNVNNIKYPVPQVGWSKIYQNSANWNDTLLSENLDGEFMYFVHSYYVELSDRSLTLTTTRYGQQEYCSSIQSDNIFATQFHPEKSGETGLKIYNNIKSIIAKS